MAHHSQTHVFANPPFASLERGPLAGHPAPINPLPEILWALRLANHGDMTDFPSTVLSAVFSPDCQRIVTAAGITRHVGFASLRFQR